MLAQLEARSFRNLAPLEVGFEAGAHLVLGTNGAGKTSLLEAIYLLATTRSFRTSQLGDCRRHGEPGFRLRGEVHGERRTALELSWWQGRRERSVNAKSTSLAEHLEVLPVVLWTAADAELLTGAPAERRRLLDRGVVGQVPAAIEVISRYRHALGEKRQALAREWRELEPWNRVLAAAAAELSRRRAAYVERLEQALGRVLADSRLPLPEIGLRYRPSPPSALEGEEAIARELAAAAGRERSRQRPLLGSHRDDLEVRWAGREMRRVASAGERKALGMALLAAHARVLRGAGREPIYLLDDADTELDRSRLAALWRAFLPAGQLFATSNRPEVWEQVAIDRRWRCFEGRLEAA